MKPALLACALVALLAGPSGAQRASGDPARVEQEVAAILERVASPADIARESAQLAALGPAALEPLFERLVAQRGGAEALGLARSATVLAALARLPRAEVLALLARVARSAPSDAAREACLDLLGRIGEREELKLALELGTPSDPEFPPLPSLRTALENTLLGICARERGAARSLMGFFPRALPAAQAVIAKVVARSAGSDAAGLLAGQLGSAGVEADALLLLEISRITDPYAGEDLLVRERVRGVLGHPDARLATLACLALAKLRDHGAVPDLIVLLSDEDQNLRRRAHATLTGLTGLSLPAESEAWISWLDEGLAWWEERADACRVALSSGTPAEAAMALREAAGQRVYLDQVVDVLALALQRSEPDVLKSACRALGAIHDPGARKVLLPVLAHPDPTVVAGARTALQRHERAHALATRPTPAKLPARSRIQ